MESVQHGPRGPRSSPRTIPNALPDSHDDILAESHRRVDGDLYRQNIDPTTAAEVIEVNASPGSETTEAQSSSMNKTNAREH